MDRHGAVRSIVKVNPEPEEGGLETVPAARQSQPFEVRTTWRTPVE
jgi:hypothetical protein